MGGIAAILMILLIILFIGGLIVYIMHLSAMSALLNTIPQPLQKMTPGNVWLTFIPLFGIVWQYMMVAAVSDSIKAEFMRRGVQRDEDRPGYNMGLTSCILWTCRIIPYIGLIPALIGIIMRITHMNKINRYREFFEQNPCLWQPGHYAFAFNQPNYNAGQYNPQYGNQQAYNPQQQYGNQQQNPVQQYYNQQQPNYGQQYTPPQPPPQNNPNQWAPPQNPPPQPPPQNPPTDNTNPWAPPPPPAQ